MSQKEDVFPNPPDPSPMRGGIHTNDDADSSLRQLKVEKLKDENTFRKGLVRWCKWVVSIHLVLVFIIIFLVAFKVGQLSDAVLVALLGTTTATVVGLVLAIIKGLFNSSEK